MKLSELKTVLADSIESYGCVVKREENGDMYEFEYELQVQKQDAAIRFFNLLFKDNVYEELKDLGDDTKEFEKFAHFYHDERNNYSDDALLNYIKEKRDELIRYKSKDERDEENYFAARDALGNLDEYEDIL